MQLIIEPVSDPSFIMKDMVESDNSLAEYIVNCLDARVDFVPENLSLTVDGILYPLIVMGVATDIADTVAKYLDDDFGNYYDDDEVFYVFINKDMKVVDIMVNPPVSFSRVSFMDFIRRSASCHLDEDQTAIAFSDFLMRKLFLYKMRFGDMFPMKWYGETPESCISRINTCLYEGENADQCAEKHAWSELPPEFLEDEVI